MGNRGVASSAARFVCFSETTTSPGHVHTSAPTGCLKSQRMLLPDRKYRGMELKLYAHVELEEPG